MLTGGRSKALKKVLVGIMQLQNVDSQWIESKLPMENFKENHLSFLTAKGEMDIFCGNLVLFSCLNMAKN